MLYWLPQLWQKILYMIRPESYKLQRDLGFDAVID
jgi:hypothetical protein